MKNLFRYLSVTILLFSGCKTSQKTSLPPETSTDIVVEEKPNPTFSFLNEWFVPTTQEHDPYPSICSLYLEDGYLIGSGILIRPNVVLTAGHCVDDGDIFSVSIGNDEEIKVKDIVLHPRYNKTFGRIQDDIGLIFLECDSKYKPASIGCVDWMRRYQNITTVGYSFGFKKYSKPNVFRYFGTVIEEPNYMKFIPRPASVWPGDSGGGVFAKFDNKEYVVGIISNYVAIKAFNDKMVISECSATIIIKYLVWIEMEILENENKETHATIKDER